jgi:uncharacterized repeat protein (TIGR03803 family)
MSFKRSRSLRYTVVRFAVLFVLANSVTAQITEQVILNFAGYNGVEPLSPVTQDSSGRLFGATLTGGNRFSPCGSTGCGVVFELTPKAGGWDYHRLYAFQAGGDGFFPVGRLAADAAGILYGVTQFGGAIGGGAIFKLTPGIGAQWSESLVHSFGGSLDGANPVGGLTTDAAGNLYGLTNVGGLYNLGTAYRLTQSTDGSWSETVLYSFSAPSTDGSMPDGELAFDLAGNLYGATSLGGMFNLGTVFKLSQDSSGGWTESILYSFTGKAGQGLPSGTVWLDPTGNVYGTTRVNGSGNAGTVFELLNTAGDWTEITLHTFKFGTGIDGAGPSGGLVADREGNLYGTTRFGGSSGNGTVYKLKHVGDGWAESVVYSFAGGNDAAQPSLGVTFGGGNLYGTTLSGGSKNRGTVFEIKP